MPYKAFNLGFEDMQSLENYEQTSRNDAIRVGVIRLPHISNFTDFEPLIADEEVHLSFLSSAASLQDHDLIILPGSKLTVEDLKWSRRMGFDKALEVYKGTIVAICGGYEMMFESILDPDGVEDEAGSVTEGLAFLSGDIVFEKEKTVTKGSYDLLNLTLEGYEIHHGKSESLGIERAGFYGTFLHGLFDNDAFRSKLFRAIDPDYHGYDFQAYKKGQVDEFARHVERSIDLDRLIGMLRR